METSTGAGALPPGETKFLVLRVTRVGARPQGFFTVKVEPDPENDGVVTVEARGGLPVQGTFTNMQVYRGGVLHQEERVNWQEDGDKGRYYTLSPEGGENWAGIVMGEVGTVIGQGDFLLGKVGVAGSS